MRRFSVLAALFVAVPGLAVAHVSISPREAKPGAQQQYTVRVPTEGQVATTSIYLQVPEGIIVTEVPHPEGANHEVKKDGDRIIAITWTKEIPPKQSAQFLFTARNPAAAGQITWKVQQRFADGTSRDWTPGTKLTDTPATAVAPAAAPANMQADVHTPAGYQMVQAAVEAAVSRSGPRRATPPSTQRIQIGAAPKTDQAKT